MGSIQKTNDLYVIMALINARSYFRKVSTALSVPGSAAGPTAWLTRHCEQVREKFYRDSHSLEGEIRDYVNTFGFLQKNVNGLDILIEVLYCPPPAPP